MCEVENIFISDTIIKGMKVSYVVVEEQYVMVFERKSRKEENISERFFMDQFSHKPIEL